MWFSHISSHDPMHYMFESPQNSTKMSIELGKNHEYSTAHGVYMAIHGKCHHTSIIPQEKCSIIFYNA